NVQALPSPAPASFNGAVGRFTLESKLNPQSLKTNEAASLEILITGTGNIANIKAPQPEFPIDFEQYTPSEDISTRVSGSTVTGSIKTEYTFVPQSVGKFEVPQIEFSYFDPAKKDYVTLTTGGYSIDVSKGAGVTTGIVEQEDIARRATDILHIHKSDASKLSKGAVTPVFYTAKFWIVWVVILAGAVAFLLIYKKERGKRADVVGMKTARAGRVAKKRLRTAKKYMDAGNSEAFHAEVLKALWGYISDHLSIPLTDLNRANVSEKLAAHGLSEQEINRLIDILDECEMARYTPASAMRSMSEIYSDASDAMDYLSKLNKK
ncbi:MAG: BatD family protein, partial [Muribaculaceae bacterium]|nr:BatD family protein [Muribaculaceae bacterium]